MIEFQPSSKTLNYKKVCNAFLKSFIANGRCKSFNGGEVLQSQSEVILNMGALERELLFKSEQIESKRRIRLIDENNTGGPHAHVFSPSAICI